MWPEFVPSTGLAPWQVEELGNLDTLLLGQEGFSLALLKSRRRPPRGSVWTRPTPRLLTARPQPVGSHGPFQMVTRRRTLLRREVRLMSPPVPAIPSPRGQVPLERRLLLTS